MSLVISLGAWFQLCVICLAHGSFLLLLLYGSCDCIAGCKLIQSTLFCVCFSLTVCYCWLLSLKMCSIHLYFSKFCLRFWGVRDFPLETLKWEFAAACLCWLFFLLFFTVLCFPFCCNWFSSFFVLLVSICIGTMGFVPYIYIIF